MAEGEIPKLNNILVKKIFEQPRGNVYERSDEGLIKTFEQTKERTRAYLRSLEIQSTSLPSCCEK